MVAPERRVLFALAASALLHLVAVATLGRAWHLPPPASPRHSDGFVVIDATLTGPILPAVEDGASATFEPAHVPADAVAPRPANTTPPVPGAVSGSAPRKAETSQRGTPDPPVMITSRFIPDPRVVGGALAEQIERQYPEHVQRAPELRTSLAVVYPRAAMDARRQAKIVVLLAVDEFGKVDGATLTPDDPDFGTVIREALKEARFSPALRDGNFVYSWALVEFTFAIKER